MNPIVLGISFCGFMIVLTAIGYVACEIKELRDELRDTLAGLKASASLKDAATGAARNIKEIRDELMRKDS